MRGIRVSQISDLSVRTCSSFSGAFVCRVIRVAETDAAQAASRELPSLC